jgi:signal transduction histidine kinase
LLVLCQLSVLLGRDQPTPLNPNTRDPHTLHLWHLDDSSAPFADDAAAPVPLLGLLNGARAGQPSLPGLGSAISFRDNVGGEPGQSSLKGALLLARPALDCGPADNAPPAFKYFGPDGAFTYEAFIKPELSPEEAQVIALTILSMDGEKGERIFSFRIERQGFLTFTPLPDCGAKGGAMASIPTSGPHAINTRDWFHVAVSYTGNENTPDNLTLYWTRMGTGVSAANEIGKGSLSSDLNGLAGDLAIGNEARSKMDEPENAEAEPFPGLIDEVRISSVARHPTDFTFVPTESRVAPEQSTLQMTEPRNNAPFALRLVRVLVDGRPVVSPGEKLTLGSGPHRLDFDFGAPPGYSGSSFRMRSQLEGVDARWNESAPGMSLRCQVLDGLKNVVSETKFDVVGTSPGWVDRVEDSTLNPRSELIYVPQGGRELRIILDSGTPETTGSFVIDDLRVSLPGDDRESLWSNSDFRSGVNLTSPAGVPDGWRRHGSNPAIAKVAIYLENQFRERPDEALALVDGAQTEYGVWESVRALTPSLHEHQILTVSWNEAYNVIPGTLHRASYVSVPPGHFTFRAIGLTDPPDPVAASISLPIHIPPPFWQRAWFWPLLTSSVVALIALAVYRNSKRRARRKLMEISFQHALEQDRTRIARDMHDDLGTRITVLTASASLARHEIDRDPGKSRNHLDTLTKSARELVVAMDSLVWAVDPVHDSLDQFASHLMRVAGEIFRDSPVRVRLDIPPELPPLHLASNCRHNLALATKEALHNVLKYAGPCEVHLSLRYEGSRIIIEIHDTGCGFEISDVNAGHGLENLSNRLADLSGTCVITSSTGHGTRVRFECPLQPS